MKNVSPIAGQQPQPAMLVNVQELVTAYFVFRPDARITAQRVVFGTSGHRGSPLSSTFNEAHVLAITQAICLYRRTVGIDGPLFLGMDTHALAEPSFASVLEVLVANSVETMIDAQGEYTPTPVISHAILSYNLNRSAGFADGIVISPSHNPPDEGGIKYNMANGGPADVGTTSWIEKAANGFLSRNLNGIKRHIYARALKSALVHPHDYVSPYVNELASVLDLNAIRGQNVHIGIDPMGGAAVHYWGEIVEKYGIDATVVNDAVDPTFRFMHLDYDEKIRMDCSSPYAMAGLIAIRDKFDVAFGNDTDADRHGIVCPAFGLMDPNSYLSAAIAYLFSHRPNWAKHSGVGKSIVSSSMIDRVAAKLDRELLEMPVGFKWFSAGLGDATLAFAGEESAGATFLRRDGSVWTTDKDGLIMGLLAAEITARTGMNPQQYYDSVTSDLGKSYYRRVDIPVSHMQKDRISNFEADNFDASEVGGERIELRRTCALGNNRPMGGVKIITKNGWYAVRASGTEDIYKIYAESFRSEAHLNHILEDAREAISKNLIDGSAPQHAREQGALCKQ
jgi:phosphoglucomutase